MTQMTASVDTFGIVIMGTDGHGAFYGLANPPAETGAVGGVFQGSVGSPVGIVFV